MTSFPDFSARSHRTELMDDPTIQGHELHETLDGLERINRLFRGYEPSIAGISKLIASSILTHPQKRAFTLLDVGTGSADTPRQLCRWAKSNHIHLKIHGIDLTPTTIKHARMRSLNFPNIHLEQRDLFTIEAHDQFDIVHAALMLHHLNDLDAIRALRKMYKLSKLGVVINDLHRHPLNFAGSRILLPCVSQNRLVRHDGPLSVLRAFTRPELLALIDRADLPTPHIRWRAPFRWQVVIPRAA